MINKPYKTFAILSEPRTGSTVISNKFVLLDGIHCQGEIFHPDEIYCSVSKDSIPDINERNRNPIKFLEKIFEQTYLQKKQPGLIGFKLFFDHNPLITHYLVEMKVPIILLERTNKLAQYSSLKVAKKTGQWHSQQPVTKEQAEKNKKYGKKVRFSLIEFLAFSIRSRYRFNTIKKILKQNDSPFYYVEYEKMFKSNEWKNIVDFLQIEVADIDVSPSIEKQSKGGVLNNFSNAQYAFQCCKLVLFFPFLSKYLNITPNLILKNGMS